MSYARMNGVDSDVYVYHHYLGFIECCGCSLTPAEEYEDVGFAKLQTAREALTHLDLHVAAGDRVPERAYTSIKEEYPDLDAQIEEYVTPPEVLERVRKKIEGLFNE